MLNEVKSRQAGQKITTHLWFDKKARESPKRFSK